VRRMKYPDGSMIQVGDLIWWDEGLCVGYVQVIAESKSDYAAWGLQAPHIFVSNTHPFDSTLLSGVSYPETCLKDEGIGLLTSDERIQLDKASARASDLVGVDLDYSTYSVTADVQNRQLAGWFFTFYKDGKELKKVKVPVEHETNA
jgi:hypothetical protein